MYFNTDTQEKKNQAIAKSLSAVLGAIREKRGNSTAFALLCEALESKT